MFRYDLTSRNIEGMTPKREGGWDAIQQSGDAIIMVWPYADADTFNFQNQSGKPVSTANSENTEVNESVPDNRPIRLGLPVILDPWLIQLNVRQSKEQHMGTMNLQMVDPLGDILSRINPGDWVMVWMFDNVEDGNKMRARIKAKTIERLNDFHSGLKFVGKLFSIRKNVQTTPTGIKTKRIQIMATSFSELDSNIYFDQQLSTNFYNGLEFMSAISSALGKFAFSSFNVGDGLASLLGCFMGIGITHGQNAIAQMSKPLLIPSEIGKLLGTPNVNNYIDVLKTYIGIQDYDGGYLPSGLKVQPPTSIDGTVKAEPFPTIFYTPKSLIGYIFPFIQPYNNVPMWSILKQNLNDTVNEMYTTLRVDSNFRIQPSLIIRQSPFNTDDFANYPDAPPHTPFRSLPRWLVTDKIITNFSLGKSDSMRINFVRIQGVAQLNPAAVQNAARAVVPPVSDAVDIQRNGLRGYVTAINSTFGLDAVASTKKWTALVTDRIMGSHLKLSGTVALTGVQEPIAVGDNLEYDGFVFHIETVEHSLNVASNSGFKQFSTSLAISNGVPASGPPLPEIAIRGVVGVEDKVSVGATVAIPGGQSVSAGPGSGVTADHEKTDYFTHLVPHSLLVGKDLPPVIGNSGIVSTNWEEDKD
jgi:hypothetical protein